MINKWLHIEELAGDQWILPIWTAVNKAIEKGTITKLPSEVYMAGEHISIRLNILPRVVKRINSEVQDLFKLAESHEQSHIFTKQTEGYVLHIDNDLKYRLLSDLDSLLFEINSVCELMSRLFDDLYSHVGKPLKKKMVGLKIKSLIENANQDPRWFSNLAKHRNFFIHEAAPYIAIDISGGKGNYELLIMKENMKTFENKDTYISLSELNEIVQGFIKAKPVIQNDLTSLFSRGA